VPGRTREAELDFDRWLNKGATIGNTLAILGIGANVFDGPAHTLTAVVFCVGFVMAGLCILVPWVAKSMDTSGNDFNL